MSMKAVTKTLATTDAETLTETAYYTQRVTLQAASTNTGEVLVGDSAAQVMRLTAGEAIDLYPDKAGDVYVKGTPNDVVNALIYC